MLATTALVMLSRKIRDDKARKRQARERASSALTDDAAVSPSERSHDAHFSTATLDGPSGETAYSPNGYYHDWQTEHSDGTAPLLGRMENGSVTTSNAEEGERPPPYSQHASEAGPSSLFGTADTSTISPTTTRSDHPDSVISGDSGAPGAIRVRTIGCDLKSGFPYHPALFDVHVRPDEWERFTGEILEATKFGAADTARMWAAATGVALTGAVLTSVFVGRSMNRKVQEKKVLSGTNDMSAGGLGEVLKHWNESYFASLGLSAHLELSDSAIRRNECHSKGSIRKPTLLYKSREDRERKREDRKFVIVVTRLDEEGVPHMALSELSAEDGPAELPTPREAVAYTSELPGDEGRGPCELPAQETDTKDSSANVLCGVSEMPATPVRDLGEWANEKRG